MNKLYFVISTLFLVAFLAFAVPSVKAGMPFNGGEYTNLWGSGTAASFHTGPNCNTGTGTCTAPNGGTGTVAKFTCDGRQTDCRSNETWSTSQNLGNPGKNKTVQLDVYSRNCYVGGNWDPNCPLVDYIVWYSGAQSTPTPTPTPTQTPAPACNDNQVALNANPKSVLPGGVINFGISGDASTWIGDNFGGGAGSCSGAWNSQNCMVSNTPGTYTWTHTWKKCEGNFNNCSNTCTKSTQFIVEPTPTVTPVPTVTPLPTPTPGQGGVVSCPSGFVKTISGSNIICVQQIQNNNQTVTSTSNASTGPINVSVAQPAIVQPQILAAKTPVVTTELPKTGLPLGVWALSGLTPLGLGLKKFGGFGKIGQETAHYLWQQREYLKK
ncbi:hypothetical protein HY385_00170 [Candidatus Daviesbacteria bacterium]|nr:hypothetical protein [Candidatus Daviesbacteria bacterium]